MLTPQAQAVVLLTTPLGRADRAGAKPLALGEWARFASWLKEQGLDPASLLEGDPAALLQGWHDPAITAARVCALLGRGLALGLALERWGRVGLWALTRADPEYPRRLKQRLGAQSPPVLFGCGNRALLGKGGVAVVGSRNAAEEDLAFAEELGRGAAAQGRSIVSGGARGVDQSAMLGALRGEGTVVGVLAGSLLKAAMAEHYRDHIASRNLALVTPFNPEARFSVGQAMGRNRYIYCLADAAVVVACQANAGGTWAGAAENLKRGWVPLWVRGGAGEGASGNTELAKLGGHMLPDRLDSLDALLNGFSAVAECDGLPGQAELF